MNALLRTLVAASESPSAAVVLKATLVLLLALALLRASRRVSASLRHRLAAVTFGVLLLLPLVAAFAPSRVVNVPAAVVAQDNAADDVAAATPGRVTLAARAAEVAKSAPVDIRSILIKVYVTGAAFFLLSLAGGIWRLYRMRDRAQVTVVGTRLAKEIAFAEGITRPVEVMITSALAVPMTFGSSRATILLPAESGEWDDVEMRRAIRHELEHIERGDWTTQILSRLACALYWPHPLVWPLWQRLRLEAERACDDAVIRTDAAAEAYAEQLVTLARQVMTHGEVPALAMATRSNLGQRVEAILDRGLRRGRLSRVSSVTVAAIALACLIGLAPLRVMSATLTEDEGRRRGDYETENTAERVDVWLFNAAGSGDTEAVRRLLDRGANANVALRGDGTPLMQAAEGGHLKVMTMLIDAGADVNRPMPGDGNALIAAARAGHVDAVRLLLDRGAEIDAGVPGDGNALIMAAGEGNTDVVRFLLDRGAAIEAVVKGDENALIHASERGKAETVKLLIDRGANVNARVWADFSYDGNKGGEWRTAMLMARRHGHEDVVQILRAARARE